MKILRSRKKCLFSSAVLPPCALLFSLILSSVSVPHARAAGILKVGLLQEPKTLNIWLASGRWSKRVLAQMYHPLFIRDPDTLDLVPWLAEEAPVYDEAHLTYTVKIRPAKWSDGSPLTSKDVAFTGKLIKSFKVPRYVSLWKFVEKIETPDDRTVKFYLKKLKAIFRTRTLLTPIVQEKKWTPIIREAKKTEKPLKTLLHYKVDKPLANGPFVLKEWRQGAYLFLQRNKYFFGTGQKIQGRTLGPYIQGILFKFFGTSDAAIMALKKGDIDMFWWGIQPGYLQDLKEQKDIRLFANPRSALYYMGFNVRKAPFSDATLRRAIATLIDKDFIISRILQGYGTKMDSIVPPGNLFWHCPDLPTYGEGLSREDRIRKAFQMLRKAGYSWQTPPVQTSGKITHGRGIRLPDGRLMEKFTILTPPADYDPLRAMAGMIIQEWLRAVGIPASAKPMAFGALIQQVKVRRDFDCFILGYGRLSLDPDYLRSFFHSRNDKPRGRNMSGYRNPEFDKLADRSTGEMDRQKRRQMIWKMQEMIMRDVPYIPLYNPELVEAVRKNRFTGWVQTLEGIGNAWSFCLVRPK